MKPWNLIFHQGNKICHPIQHNFFQQFVFTSGVVSFYSQVAQLLFVFVRQAGHCQSYRISLFFNDQKWISQTWKSKHDMMMAFMCIRNDNYLSPLNISNVTKRAKHGTTLGFRSMGRVLVNLLLTIFNHLPTVPCR